MQRTPRMLPVMQAHAFVDAATAGLLVASLVVVALANLTWMNCRMRQPSLGWRTAMRRHLSNQSARAEGRHMRVGLGHTACAVADDLVGWVPVTAAHPPCPQT